MGELQGIVEKSMRHGTGVDMSKAGDELGDILHCAFAVIGTLGLDPDELMMDNIQKVTKRRQEGYYGKALEAAE